LLHIFPRTHHENMCSGRRRVYSHARVLSPPPDVVCPPSPCCRCGTVLCRLLFTPLHGFDGVLHTVRADNVRPHAAAVQRKPTLAHAHERESAITGHVGVVDDPVTLMTHVVHEGLITASRRGKHHRERCQSRQQSERECPQ